MARTVEEIMTHDPRTVDAGASLGDLAVERDPDSALADISTGTPDR
jgi:hypothetical protein